MSIKLLTIILSVTGLNYAQYYYQNYYEVPKSVCGFLNGIWHTFANMKQLMWVQQQGYNWTFYRMGDCPQPAHRVYTTPICAQFEKEIRKFNDSLELDLEKFLTKKDWKIVDCPNTEATTNIPITTSGGQTDNKEYATEKQTKERTTVGTTIATMNQTKRGTTADTTTTGDKNKTDPTTENPTKGGTSAETTTTGEKDKMDSTTGSPTKGRTAAETATTAEKDRTDSTTKTATTGEKD